MPNLPNFAIPEDLTPDTFCLCLQIPNDPTWIQNFVGLLAQPRYWFNWDRDTGKSGKILADYWTVLYDQIDWSTMSCCSNQPPAIFRYNSDGVYQRSDDGGETWVDAPEYDYRNTSTTFPPPSALGIDNTKCQAADSAVKTIDQQIIQALNESFAAAQILALIAAVLLAVLSAGSLAALTPLITAIGSAIIDVGVTVTQAAFTSDVWDRLRCNIYCNMDSDSSINASGLMAILTQLGVDETGIVYTVLFGVINAAGVVGLTNMIRSNNGDPDADCSGCCTGGCDLSLWAVPYGTVVSQTSGQIVVTADLEGDGLYYAVVYAPTSGDCCCLVLTGITPLDQNLNYIRACGLDPSLIATNSDGMNTVYNGSLPNNVVAYLTRAAGVFTVTITSTPC